ncbi:glutamyl-tRNA synthetase [Rubrobacter xylanophilus DSM 9941]|uniref:Glutamate--tRNA ligase 2 n=1 Tax=Rubrobacter xylanophilus (strain DSM 9941 / JCM 11954 / NBRC 16129 / PRD-1) TaxID=266117 RepID=SYE2_RUBXD|nr:glutamate--tRNA ligase [Rubrobacter xylanophilus]Q1AS60.1 RecName: Full=Glutamate--tRNA ligase 2; AltName: Full=Glutamyl-tRNA synthetase 2; Short=GluRS 2 [Rubrobacter xylanophilus DSM 9941]ABG05768.1 glutamyl-tRNA synthetase [Rubrobacter xylanophilus DSM 9941]
MEASRQVRVRYAPSPTGRLHVGGVRTALFNWLFARKHGGVFILRIEDTDLERSTEESVEQLKRSLRWIGLDWDEGPDVGGPHAPYRQTERLELYRRAARRLLESGAAYYDFATPEELTRFRQRARAEGRPPIYTGGPYREMDPEEALRRVRMGEPHTVRFKTPREGRTVFEDIIRGPVGFENATIEDFVLLKSTGTPTYNFAAAVDDAEMQITHVIRGDDHISNTPRQIMIHRALGHELPAFAHVPQVLGPDRKKLSKRHGAASVEDFAEQGILPEALFNYLALLGAGYAADEEIFAPEELAERFRLEKVSGNPAIFDEQKLLAINAVYIRRKSPEELAMLAAPMLSERGVADAGELERDMPRLVRIMELLRERLQRTTDIPEAAGYFYGERLDYDREQFEKQFGKEFVRENLPELYRRLKALPEWTADAIESCVRGLAAEKEKGARHLIHPLRFATTGRTVSAGLFETMELIGRERCLLRIADVLERLQSPERSL